MTDAAAPAAASAGALLRAAREKRGLHIAALAAAIKVAPRKLDALENDRWHELPDANFTRALAQTVCRSLKIDARPVLDLLPPAEAAALESRAGSLNEPFREHAARDDGGWAGQAVRPMIVAAALLMAAAIAVYLAPAAWWSSDQVPPAAAPAPASAASLAALALPASAAPPAAAASALEAPGAVAAVPPPAPAAASTPAPAASAAGLMPPAAAASAVAPAIGVLVLRASAASWVDVRDARGRVLLSRTLQPGETVGLDGEAPLRLVVGNAASTEVVFRGQPVPLAPHTRDTVARLELK
ncbi:MAG: hypothetical protein AMXMBFR66_30450 [Pseudomonadota bacterium]|nr:helix-turn-helix domain-containing protein [Rubrivivax sp.]NLZ39925.1 helix-turn-helix domain-containing protein [Comamonadaceae bacterium]